jgi:hypothetical protein
VYSPHRDGHTAPPSTHVSPPFCTPSSHRLATHVPFREQISESHSAPRVHGWPAGQRPHAPPHAPGAHVAGAAHTRFTHEKLAQSPCARHASPAGHSAHVGPPQPRPVSSPSRTRLSHHAAAHVPVTVEQYPLAHWPWAVQGVRTAHRGQPDDTAPQSTPDSPPSTVPLVQCVGSEQRSVMESHTPVTQSASAVQRCVPVHFAAHVPPQSVSLSCAAVQMPSLHVGARHTPDKQMPDVQWLCAVQPDVPSGHGAHGPPQSTPISAPPFTPLKHAAGAAQ